MILICIPNRRRAAATVISALLLLALVGFIVAGAGRDVVLAVANSGKLVPIYSVAREDRGVSITVDATWGDDKTLALLDLFDSENVRVTFFLAGNWIASFPEMVTTISRRGHEVGNHSWTHPNMGPLPRERIREELEKTQAALAQLTGSRPKVFRPPFGDYSNNLITVAEECGLRTIQWSIDSLDWKGLSAGEIYDRVMGKMRPGAIVLFHNAGEHTVEALQRIIPDLKRQGYTITPVSELLLDGDTYIDRNTGEQRRAVNRTTLGSPAGKAPYTQAGGSCSSSEDSMPPGSLPPQSSPQAPG